jgi:hypothetical protein
MKRRYVVPMTLTVSKIQTPKNIVYALKNVAQDYDLQKKKKITETSLVFCCDRPPN